MASSSFKKNLSQFVSLSALAAAYLWAPAASAQNLITNGTFDADSDPWWGHAAEGFDHTIEVVDGRMCSTITEGGENPWDIIIGFSEVALVAGQHYRISFSASSDTPRKIRYKTGLGDAPYTDYFLGKIDLSPTPVVFEATYLNLREDATAQFQFQFGGSAGVVCYDDIVLEPVAAPVPVAYVTPSATGLPLKNGASLVKMGTAVDTPTFLSNPAHNAIVASEFSMITPANSMKMNIIQPTQGVFDFIETDAMLTWADQNGLEFHGHPLIWHTQAPGWLEEQELTRDEMIAVMYAHIDALMQHYAGRMPYWDVVNEAIEQTDGVFGWRPTIWHDRIGADFIDLAFTRAAQNDPNVKLLYNDYNIAVMGHPKADHVFNMISDMRTRGIPVTTIGMQNHWFVTPDGGTSGLPDVAMIKANMDRYASIGVDVQITECDVRIGNPLTPEKQQMQAKVYQDILQACIDAPNCNHMTVWGLSDIDSWVPSTFEEYDHAHIFDPALQPKEAYQSLAQVFAAATPAQNPAPGDVPLSGAPTDDSGGASKGCSYRAGASSQSPWQFMLVGLLTMGLWYRRSAKRSAN